jgi:hypothetical protein
MYRCLLFLCGDTVCVVMCYQLRWHCAPACCARRTQSYRCKRLVYECTAFAASAVLEMCCAWQLRWQLGCCAQGERETCCVCYGVTSYVAGYSGVPCLCGICWCIVVTLLVL